MERFKVRRRDRAIRSARILALWLLAAFCAIGIPLLLAWLAIAREPAEWHWNDWVAQLTQILTGIIFFGLAWILGRSSEARSEAIASAELITSMGALSTSSARSYAGHDAQSLRIAADARAALQHYARAAYREQYKLTEKVIDSYSDLIFGTFSRANGLPRSIWNGLRDGAVDVISDAKKLAQRAGRRHSTQRDELLRMAEHIGFAVNLGRLVRSPAESFESGVAPGSPRTLEKVWRRPDETTYSALERVMQLELLYRRELTVIRDWNLLRRNADRVHCSVILHDVRDSGDWLSPWYVKRIDGRLAPVNVRGNALYETARFDRLADGPGVPVHPRPLRHGELPTGMRQLAIGDHLRILGSAGPVTICVLSYEVICDDNLRKRRVVLDGNHRLAAARRIAEMSATDPAPRSVHVLEFLISEQERLDQDAVAPDDFPGWKWKGFTPDVENVRSAWAD